MIKESTRLEMLEREKYFPNPIIVNKKNYHLVLFEFNQILSKPSKKFLFFNLEFSNVKNFTQINIQPEDYLIDYIRRLNEIKQKTQNETQIMYTEFLICKQSKKTRGFKFFSYLIPSIKFHKLKERESFLKIDPDALNYFYMNKASYSFSKACQVDSISYTSLVEKEKIEINLNKILEKGKPTKKENTKSYYFFPKNIFLPTREKQEDLVLYIKDCFYELQEIQSTTETSSDDYAYKPIWTSDNYIAERLIHFDWRILLNQLDKNVVRAEIDKCWIKSKKGNENSEVRLIFLNFCNELLRYIKEIHNLINKNFGILQKFPNFVINSPNGDNLPNNKLIYVWKRFIESFFSDKISIEILQKENESDYRKIEFEFKLMRKIERIDDELNNFENFLTNLIKIFEPENQNSFEEAGLFKNPDLNSFNLLSLFPDEISQSLEIRYYINIVIHLKNLKEISLDRNVASKFTYDELFFNMNNEKEILFNYDLETELYKFVAELGNISSYKRENRSTKNIFHFNNKEFFQDFLIISKCKGEKLMEIFDNFIISIKFNEAKRELTFSFNSREKNKLELFLNSFKENEKNYKYKLMELFTTLKKEMVIDEEFGVSNFFKFLLDSKLLAKSQLTIVGCNMLFKFSMIFLEFFSDEKGINFEDFTKFLYNVDLNFIDLNYLSKKNGLKFFNELNYVKKYFSSSNDRKNLMMNVEYSTQKYFLLLLKCVNRMSQLDQDGIDGRILFVDDNVANIKNKIFLNQISDYSYKAHSEISILGKDCKVIKETINDNYDESKSNNKLFIHKNKYDSIESLIEKCKDYGSFMVFKIFIRLNFKSYLD